MSMGRRTKAFRRSASRLSRSPNLRSHFQNPAAILHVWATSEDAETCSRCGLEKPLRDFYRQAGGAQGRRAMCKECFRAAERASYASEDFMAKQCRLNAASAVEVWRSSRKVTTTS
jgi:hypothetical protein